MSALTGSSKIRMDSPRAKIKRVYRNGAITAISPALVAKTTATYAPVPASVAVNNNIRLSGVMGRNGPKKGVVTTPARNEAKNAQNEIVAAGIDVDIPRVIVSLNARKKTAAMANKAAGLNPSKPG